MRPGPVREVLIRRPLFGGGFGGQQFGGFGGQQFGGGFPQQSYGSFMPPAGFGLAGVQSYGY
jgi:hypothetical protein